MDLFWKKLKFVNWEYVSGKTLILVKKYNLEKSTWILKEAAEVLNAPRQLCSWLIVNWNSVQLV